MQIPSEKSKNQYYNLLLRAPERLAQIEESKKRRKERELNTIQERMKTDDSSDDADDYKQFDIKTADQHRKEQEAKTQKYIAENEMLIALKEFTDRKKEYKQLVIEKNNEHYDTIDFVKDLVEKNKKKICNMEDMAKKTDLKLTKVLELLNLER